MLEICFSTTPLYCLVDYGVEKKLQSEVYTSDDQVLELEKRKEFYYKWKNTNERGEYENLVNSSLILEIREFRRVKGQQ